MEEYNKDKIDDVVLALLYLNAWKDEYGHFAWKSLNWDALNRLYDKELISDPKNKSKSVFVSDEGIEKAKALAEMLFREDSK